MKKKKPDMKHEVKLFFLGNIVIYTKLFSTFILSLPDGINHISHIMPTAS